MSTNNKLTEIVDDEASYQVIEEVIKVHGFELEPVEEKPLTSLNIEAKIEKLEKPGSFAADLFIGKYDDDFLTYPDPLFDRVECKHVLDQMQMIRQLWPKIWNDNLQLQKYNFFNLYQLSVTEMMSAFEAIGNASRDCFEVNLSSNVDQSAAFLSGPSGHLKETRLNEFNHFHVTQSIISLITRNCLTYWPIHKSDNTKLKDAFLPKRHILFGGSKDDNDLYPQLGFAWSEKAPQLGTVPPQNWSTTGIHGGTNSSHYAIKGIKHKILTNKNLQHYLVFFKDGILSQQYADGPKGEEPNPETDPFIGCCVLHKSEIQMSESYQDSAGFSYQDASIDTVVEEERRVIEAKRMNPHPNNIKGLGQLAVCSVQLGLLKATMRNTYMNFIKHKTGLLSCDIVERKFADITGKIFAIESMIYYVAGMYDGLKDGFDAHLEALMTKIITTEFSYDIFKDIQHLSGSDLLNTSRMQDQFNIFDTFLDGAIHNRIYLSSLGILWYARNSNKHLNQMKLAPWYPGYFCKTMVKEMSNKYDWMTIEADIYGNLHPSLAEAGKNLTWILKRIRYSTDLLCQRHSEEVFSQQAQLTRLSSMVVNSFLLTATCARASKAYCNGAKFSEMDVNIATALSDQIVRDSRLYLSELELTPIATNDARCKLINEYNMRSGGYYAHSPLDPNI